MSAMVVVEGEKEQTYDVAVTGAGPSGVMAAWKAAESGARTILLERESNPGRKVCAEGVLADALPDALIAPADDFVANKISGAFLYPPDESKRVNVGGEGYILDKPAFLEALAGRARGKGADVVYGGAVEELVRDKGQVIVRGRVGQEPFAIRASVVIGCDGVGSLIARRYFARKNYMAIAALQYHMTGCKVDDESKLEIYVGHDKAPSGYVWVFPKGGDEANVGIGLKGANAKLMLDRFVAGHPRIFSEARVERSLAAPVPVGGEIDKYVVDNIMLCGDAAGQVIPLTGAGIHTSLVAGRIAGEVAGDAVRVGDFSDRRLSEYQKRFDGLFGRRIANSLKALESFERFSDDDFNIIADFLEGQDLLEMANGFNPTRAVNLLVRHPILAIKVAYQLLTS